MSNTDKTYANRYNILRGRLIYNFHLQNPTKRLEGPSTPASIVTIMNNSRATGSCCSTSIPSSTSIPVVIDITTTVLVYGTDQGSSFEWDGNTFTRNTDLPNFSYTAIITSIPAIIVPEPTHLTSVTIGNTVTSIGSEAFSNCSTLTSVTFAPTSTLTSIAAYAFSNCFALPSIIIPNSVTSIGNNAFYNCTNLISITIPDSVTSIGSDAFKYSGLTTVTIPDSVTSIGSNAFQGCTSLTSVTFAPTSTLTSMGDGAFNSCSGLTSITIPNSVTSIGDYTFNGCSALTSITIPNSVLSIGDYTFIGSGLTDVTIASGQLGIPSPQPNPPGVLFFGVMVATILP